MVSIMQKKKQEVHNHTINIYYFLNEKFIYIW